MNVKRTVLLFLIGTATLHGATYYVNSIAGDDALAGTSDSTPWKTLNKVNTTEFKPGDRILFQSGSVWRGQLAPKSSGSEGQPIVIDRYGEGVRPRIDGNGQVEDALRLYNLQYIEVRGLEITNHGADAAVRRGVHIILDNFGTAKNIVVAELFIHDVNGSNQRKDNGGIIFSTVGNKIPSRFDGLTIERNIVWKVDRSAIMAHSYHANRFHWFPSLHVVIRDNLVDDIGGDGIVPLATDSALIEHNIARNCNRRAGIPNAGIWAWGTEDSLFQLNEASFTRTTRDGEGFDSDYNSHNTIFQYNYSHDNEGGFMLICSPGDPERTDEPGIISNFGTIVRRNISRNDRSRIFYISAIHNATVSDNAIYVGKDLDVQMVIASYWDGWADGVVFKNNFFYVDGTARYGHEVSRQRDGVLGIGAGWAPAKNIQFVGNHYIGNHVDRPDDPTGVVQDTAAKPKLDWDEPTFDPSSPNGFDNFMVSHRRWMMRLFTSQFGTVTLGR